MKLKRITHLILTALFVITLAALSGYAQQPQSLQQDLSLSNAQVLRLQALLMAQTTEIRSLNVNVQAAQETLKSAVLDGEPVRIATAVLSLDAAQKALKNTELANQRSVMSLLNDSQKQLIEKYSAKSASMSD